MPFSLVKVAKPPNGVCPLERWIKAGNISSSRGKTSLWHKTRCTSGCWARCLVRLWRCLWNVVAIRQVSCLLEKDNHSAHPQEELGGGPCLLHQPFLNTWVKNETDNPGRHFQSHEETYRNSQPGFIKCESCLTSLIAPHGDWEQCVSRETDKLRALWFGACTEEQYTSYDLTLSRPPVWGVYSW